MHDFTEELSHLNNGHALIGAIDEAGRGPLAGPVVAACVLIDKNAFAGIFKIARIEDVNDSKKLSEKKRNQLFKIISENFPVGVGICDHETIDRINILESTFLAMKKAVCALKQKPDILLVDGKFRIPNISIAQKTIVHGDSLVFSIAAASIIAKVTRDQIMKDMDIKYPGYAFSKHKGYGTKDHIKNIKRFGPCVIHRKSFEPIKSLFNQ